MNTEPRPREITLDLLGLLKAVGARWKFLAFMAILGSGAGPSWILLTKKIYVSSVSFAQSGRETEMSSFGGMGALSLLGFGSASGEPPLIKFFEKYLQTREFVNQLKDSAFHDTSVYRKLLGTDTLHVAASEIFLARLTGLFKIKRDNGLITLSVMHQDPEFAHFLVDRIFDCFYREFESERKKSIRDNLGLVQEIVERTKFDLQRANANLRVFMDRNRGFGSPESEQRRGELLLEVKLQEERYVAAEKEKSLQEIRNEKKERPLVVIEKPYVPLWPRYPRKRVVMTVSLFCLLLAGILISAYRDRAKWISTAGS